MRQRFSKTLHFLANFSLYFFLVFIPLNFLLSMIFLVTQDAIECSHLGCFEGWIVPVIILNGVITAILAWKRGALFNGNKGWQVVIVTFVLTFGGCCLLFSAILFWDNVWGAFVERVIHYPNSELVLVEHGAYGSSDYGTKIYLRWTEDTVAQVEAHYDRFPLYSRHAHIIASEEDSLELTACRWGIGFYHRYRDDPENHPCSLVKRMLDERGGTMIEFSHAYFAG